MWNDADLEMAELEEVGNAAAAARAAGQCPHLSVRGEYSAAGSIVCSDGCGKRWLTLADWLDAQDEVIGEWL